MTKPWRWEFSAASRQWHLRDARGRDRCTIWPNSVWHTWDEHGVGGENDTAMTVAEAKEQALAAVIRQGWAILVTAPRLRADASTPEGATR